MMLKKQQSCDIIIFVEHVVRELDIACILKYLIYERYGINVIIASIVDDLDDTIIEYLPKIVVTPFFYSANDYGIEKMIAKWNDITFINLMFEQVLQKINQRVKVPHDEYAKKYVFHHAWSKSYGDFLGANNILSTNIFINGNPIYT